MNTTSIAAFETEHAYAPAGLVGQNLFNDYNPNHARLYQIAESEPSAVTRSRQIERSIRHNQMRRSLSRRRQIRALVLLMTSAIAAVIAVSAWTMVGQTSTYRALMASDASTPVTVQPGDTLWSIADRNPVSNLSTYEAVRLISDLNGLEASSIYPGQTILVPTAG